MPVACDIIVQWNATSEQLAALGTALWRWCNRMAADTGSYQYLDNQALADLIAGKLPRSGQHSLAGDRPGVHIPLRDEASEDRRATIEGLRRELQAGAIEDIVVAGASWNCFESEPRTGPRPGTIHGPAPDRCAMHPVEH